MIKSFTSLEQSKKLAEILPLESADYCWGIDDETLHYNNSPYPCAWKDYTCKEYYIPCWSLSALLSILPEGVIENYYAPNLQKEKGKYSIAYGNEELLHVADNPVDACYELILKLKELNLL